jgi:hypothetical protein
MCVRGIDFASVSTIFQLDFGTNPNVWYFFVFILFHTYMTPNTHIHDHSLSWLKLGTGTSNKKWLG